MRRSIPSQTECTHPGPGITYDANGRGSWCMDCGAELTVSADPIPGWAVILVVVGGAALLMALVFFVLTWQGSPGPGVVPGRGVSTYGPPSAELRMVG